MSKCDSCIHSDGWWDPGCWRKTKDCDYTPKPTAGTKTSSPAAKSPEARGELVCGGNTKIDVKLEIEKNPDGYLTGRIKINGAELYFKADLAIVGRDVKNDCIEHVKIHGKAGASEE